MGVRKRCSFTCEGNPISLFPPQGFCPFSFGIQWLVPSPPSRLPSVLVLTSSERLSLTSLPKVRPSTSSPAAPGVFPSAYHYLTLPRLVLLLFSLFRILTGVQGSCLSFSCCTLEPGTVPGTQQALKRKPNEEGQTSPTHTPHTTHHAPRAPLSFYNRHSESLSDLPKVLQKPVKAVLPFLLTPDNVVFFFFSF